MVFTRYRPPVGEEALWSLSVILATLIDAQDAEAAVETARAEFRKAWGSSGPEGLLDRVQRARADTDPDVTRWREWIAASSATGPEPGSDIEQLAAAKPLIEAVWAALDGLVVDVDELPLSNVEGTGPSLTGVLQTLADPASGPAIQSLNRPLLALHDHPAVMFALRRLPAPPDDVEYAVCSDALAQAGLPADRLTLEITESVVLQDLEDVIPRLSALRERGARVAIDDFGTGYSSLAYLTELPVDVLKVDKSFIDRVALDEQGASLTEAIIAMSHSMKLTTVAEGVEVAEQAAWLRKVRCPIGQGYYWSRPVDLAGVHELLGRPTNDAGGELGAPTYLTVSPGLPR